MQFLRTLFWVLVAVFVAILATNNWTDVTINLWDNLRLDTKLPVLVALAVLAGFLPTYLVQRAKVWTLKRRLAAQTQPPVVTTNQPASATSATPGASEGLTP